MSKKSRVLTLIRISSATDHTPHVRGFDQVSLPAPDVWCFTVSCGLKIFLSFGFNLHIHIQCTYTHMIMKGDIIYTDVFCTHDISFSHLLQGKPH